MRLYKVALKYRIMTQYTKIAMMLTVCCMRTQAIKLYTRLHEATELT